MSWPKIRVRETMCGWNATTTRPSPASERAACEVAGDLLRVVGVAVVDADAGGLALELHPAAGAAEGTQAAGEVREGEPEPQPAGQRAERVQDVVPPGDLQGDLAEPAAAVDHGEGAGRADEAQVLGAHLGLRPGADGDHGRGPGSAAVRASAAAPGSSAHSTRKPSGETRSRNSSKAAR